ncbi:uncharacterized protein LOC122399879 [Colletes gigas]|uniref:uncharacterized protein LOC122399879 n=1 Tax=Colletes gigas TaxID=935657 RepID=UPI001C9AA9DA|nr:uncharacterized protein LOC122399879 [Colletes gigas]
MSGPGKSTRPVRQLSLQPTAPRRQQIRRQRSAEDDKSSQVSAGPLARGKRGTNGKPCSERLKVRVAWSENRQKNGKDLEHIEVVARQIPGRSRPATGKTRGFNVNEKPTILYSRQELAERLRLAWKHREENKANINIFLAHGILQERCDSEMSQDITTQDKRVDEDYTEKGTESTTDRKSTTVLANSEDIPNKDGDELSDFQHSFAEIEEIADEKETSERGGRKWEEASNAEEKQTDTNKKPEKQQIPRTRPNYSTPTQKPTQPNDHPALLHPQTNQPPEPARQNPRENHPDTNTIPPLRKQLPNPRTIWLPSQTLHNPPSPQTAGRHCARSEQEQIGGSSPTRPPESLRHCLAQWTPAKTTRLPRSSNVDEHPSSSKKKSSLNIDYSNIRDLSSSLPSIKNESSTSVAVKTSKDDFSTAKQKRASFHSGGNKAFLEPIRSSIESKWCPVVDKAAQQKLTTDAKSEKGSPTQKNLESKDNVTFNRAAVAKNPSEIRCGSIERNARTRTTVENKTISSSSEDDKTIDQKISDNKISSTIKKTASTNNIAENKDGSIDKNIYARNASDVACGEKNSSLKKMIEPQKIEQKSRRTSSAPPQRHLGNASTSNRVQVNIVINPSSTPASGKNNDQEKTDTDCKDNRIDTASTKVSSGRSVRSAPLKKRSRSAKRRFWGTGSCKNDEDGKSRNQSAGRGRNPIDSKAIDIVTMVSLVSSADSGSDTENSPRDDKLIDQLRSKLPTTSIIKTSMNPTLSVARKPIKSVSFQRHSVDEDPPNEQPSPNEEKKTTPARLAIVNRGNRGATTSEETLPWRSDIPGLALPILALIHDPEEAHDVPLTDREKRCLAVPIGDLHDGKRKLFKTRSTPSRPVMEKQTISSKVKMQESPRTVPQNISSPVQHVKTPATNYPANVRQMLSLSSNVMYNKLSRDNSQVKQTCATTSNGTIQHVQPAPVKPQFHTNKEKECWHLYRKMCDKGVSVSFDTVLRGILTPTEYRLRQRELLQDSQ